MNKQNLIILNNEKVFKDGDGFFCENLDLKIVPEGLNNFFNVKFIVRSSKKKGAQKLNLKDVNIASNIFLYIFYVIKSFNINSKYLIISITPYTFLAYLFLLIFRKKVYLYLWSDGHEEWEYLIGKWSVWIYSLMYNICILKSEIIVCNKRLTKKKSHLISISRLDEQWFSDIKKVSSDKANFLYVGRISKEKGIFDFIKIFDEMNLNSTLSIVGNAKKFSFNNPKISKIGYISDANSLIRIYDKCNITILPSYTEGYPYVIDESLSRLRPVIIFEEISYVVNDKEGIYISKRNSESLRQTTEYILKNYTAIQSKMSKNTLPTKKSMLKQISDIIVV